MCQSYSAQIIKDTQSTNKNVEVKEVGCMGICHKSPNIRITNNETKETTTHSEVSPEEAKEITRKLN